MVSLMTLFSTPIPEVRDILYHHHIKNANLNNLQAYVELSKLYAQHKMIQTKEIYRPLFIRTMEELAIRDYRHPLIYLKNVNKLYVQKKAKLFTPQTTQELKNAVSEWYNFDKKNLYTGTLQMVDSVFKTNLVTSAVLKKYGDINTWNTENITDMSLLFSTNRKTDVNYVPRPHITDDPNFKDQPIEEPNNIWVEEIRQIRDEFFLPNEPVVRNVPHFEPLSDENVYNMLVMLNEQQNDFNQPLPTDWDVSNVTNMSNMFSNCHLFNQPLPETWDTSNVTDMSFMFRNCTNFNQIIPTSWNLSSLRLCAGMFFECSQFNQPLPENLFANLNSSTNLGELYPMVATNIETEIKYMLFKCSSFNQPLPESWDTSRVKNMSYMLYQCTSFNQLFPYEWDVSNVTDMNSMFAGCISLNQPLPDNWDISCVMNMMYMFGGCISLEQGVVWDTKKVKHTTHMFWKSSVVLDTQNKILLFK